MTRKLAFISGTSIARSALFADWPERRVPTAFGDVLVREAEGLVLLNRHGPAYLPPHAINHRANLRALADLGCDTVLSLNSVGSLREDLPPGTLGSCSDHVSFRPATFRDDRLNAMGPEIANDLVAEVAEVVGMEIRTGLVYVQTPGPRFETRAEVRIIRGWGDVVGMTMSSEADLAQEAGLRYNSFCIIDNYANGIGGSSLSEESFRELVRANQEKVNVFFARLIAHFGRR